MRSSWISTGDLQVSLEISGILFWVVQADNIEHARAISFAWNNEAIKYPFDQTVKAI
jgi:hypothetical protein